MAERFNAAGLKTVVVTSHLGFESLFFRQEQSHSNSNVGVRFFYFCIKGVAGFVVPTQKIEYTQIHYLNQKRIQFGDFCKL